MLWLAEGDALKMEYFRKMPLIDYYTLLDAKIARTKELMTK